MTRITSLTTCLIDIPTIRPHKLSFGAIQQQSYCIVRAELANGSIGWGEAATIGGASWNEESPESIRHAIDSYLAPVLIGQVASQFEALLLRMDKSCRGNYFAKSAVEMALVDAVARSHGLAAYDLFGGKIHSTLPLAWTLATGDVEKDLSEAIRMLEERRHRIFKIKIGAKDPLEDVSLVTQVSRSLAGRASLTVDINQAWDGNTARLYLPQLADAGIRLVEQPVAKWNTEALASLVGMSLPCLVMADESVCSPQEAYSLARHKAAQVFSLKLEKHGGLHRTRRIAAIAEAADIDWYGGTMLGTSLGSAASAQLFSTLAGKHHGCELFGPQLLVDDIVVTPMVVKDFELHIPDGPGFGITIDETKLRRFDRDRVGLNPVVIDLGRRSQT